jgi:hypothetical protein
MSIASLLSHHGLAAPRYVSVDGRVVFDGVTATASGMTHHTLGAVTSVRDHTFHDGYDPVAPIRAGLWWSEPGALDGHLVAMGRAFPSFTYFAPTDLAAPTWRGKIDTGRGSFVLEAALRSDRGLPSVKVLGPKLGAFSSGRWVPSPHLYVNGNLCIADRADWDLKSHDISVAVAWGAHWLAAYTEWRMSRRWPADGTTAHAA